MFRQDFGKLDIFHGLSNDQLALLDPILESCHFSSNEVVFEQGQHTDYLYILLRGKVEVQFKPYDGPPLTVARIEEGGVFGWSTALGRESYTSTAQTTEECEAYRILGVKLHNLCNCNPETGAILLERLAGVIAERLHSTHTQILNILSKGVECNNEDMRRTGEYE